MLCDNAFGSIFFLDGSDEIRLFEACGGKRRIGGSSLEQMSRATPTDPIIDNAPLEVGIECQIHCMAGGATGSV